jgi:hypothetical protein
LLWSRCLRSRWRSRLSTLLLYWYCWLCLWSCLLLLCWGWSRRLNYRGGPLWLNCRRCEGWSRIVLLSLLLLNSLTLLLYWRLLIILLRDLLPICTLVNLFVIILLVFILDTGLIKYIVFVVCIKHVWITCSKKFNEFTPHIFLLIYVLNLNLSFSYEVIYQSISIVFTHSS